ncbi:MAG: Mur ligase family protein [Actinomycetota bacterium]|nr:Mur ligase family protein [Actinomycetota bacterium]
MPGPLEGRRIWFAGIGGAGLSGYALLAKAWGAEVAGWDKVETPYLTQLEGVPIEISPTPTAPGGWEVVRSTAYEDQIEGKPRADILAELVSLQPSIVVAGSHGKTTTTAMIAFCLDRLGNDPSFLIGGEVPQLGGSARAGTGWLVVEGDESDRTVSRLEAQVAVVTNVDLDHPQEFGSSAEVEELFASWLAGVPNVVRGEELEPAELELGVPGEHNRRNAAAALAALELAGIPRSDAESVLPEFRGVGRRLEQRGEAGGVHVVDSYAHHPAEIAADLEALRDGGRLLVLFQPHLFSRTRRLAWEFGEALASADVVAVTDVYQARDEPHVEVVSGKRVVEALAERRPGMPVAWMPSIEEGARFVAQRARPGDSVLTFGAGDVDRAVPLLLEALA